MWECCIHAFFWRVGAANNVLGIRIPISLKHPILGSLFAAPKKGSGPKKGLKQRQPHLASLNIPPRSSSREVRIRVPFLL